jgi:hypothetical protein
MPGTVRLDRSYDASTSHQWLIEIAHEVRRQVLFDLGKQLGGEHVSPHEDPVTILFTSSLGAPEGHDMVVLIHPNAAAEKPRIDAARNQHRRLCTAFSMLPQQPLERPSAEAVAVDHDDQIGWPKKLLEGAESAEGAERLLLR